jgi:hypothetical protein
MLSLQVRACLSDIMCVLYTESELEILAHKMNIRAAMYNKFQYAMDVTAQILDADGLRFVQKVIQDARKLNVQKGFVSEIVLEKLVDLERALGTSMLIAIDEKGIVSPVVPESIKPNLFENEYFLYTEMQKREFTLTNQQFDKALDIYRKNPAGSYPLIKLSLESLTQEILKSKGKTPPDSFDASIKQMGEFGILKNDEEIKSIEALYGMLRHYGSHPEVVTEEISSFLYLWTINSFTFILKRYELNKS